MKFYIENHEGKQVFEGTQVECEAEMNRLVLSGEEGYWRMFDETDHDEAWQEGGLVELAASQQGVHWTVAIESLEDSPWATGVRNSELASPIRNIQ